MAPVSLHVSAAKGILQLLLLAQEVIIQQRLQLRRPLCHSQQLLRQLSFLVLPHTRRKRRSTPANGICNLRGLHRYEILKTASQHLLLTSEHYGFHFEREPGQR